MVSLSTFFCVFVVGFAYARAQCKYLSVPYCFFVPSLLGIRDMWITMHGTHSSTVEIKPPKDLTSVIYYTIYLVGTYRDCTIYARSPHTCNIGTGRAQTRYEYRADVFERDGDEYFCLRRFAWTPPNRKHYANPH